MEFDLIARIRERAASRLDVILGIGDDAAIVSVPVGRQLVVATDTLNSGVHFPPETSPADIGWKSLAVNLSDLAAMGAEPAWCTLSLSMPQADQAWVDAFLDGFFELAARHNVSLIGGDTTQGPLSICVTAHGLIDPRGALCRSTARVDDDIWVTGTLGDAAAALAQWYNGETIDPMLRARLDRPAPRIEVGRRIAALAHACIDISDGLLADVGHICRASGVGAHIDLDELPASAALLGYMDRERKRALQVAGGDDYELCFTAPKSAREVIIDMLLLCDLPVARIGRMTADAGKISLRDADGQEWVPSGHGYEHFR